MFTGTVGNSINPTTAVSSISYVKIAIQVITYIHDVGFSQCNNTVHFEMQNTSCYSSVWKKQSSLNL